MFSAQLGGLVYPPIQRHPVFPDCSHDQIGSHSLGSAGRTALSSPDPPIQRPLHDQGHGIVTCSVINWH